MKTILTVILSGLGVIMVMECNAGFGRNAAGYFMTPKVAYIEPKDQAVVDITAKDSLKFAWRNVPMPAGGVEAYRFKVYMGVNQVIFAKNLCEGVFQVEVPASIFDDGKVYTWRVQQRDARSMNWSEYDTWSFRIVKKNP